MRTTLDLLYMLPGTVYDQQSCDLACEVNTFRVTVVNFAQDVYGGCNLCACAGESVS